MKDDILFVITLVMYVTIIITLNKVAHIERTVDEIAARMNVDAIQ